MAEEGIRSYGPGKFNDIIDSYAYELTLDGGADEEASYGEGNGWYGFLAIDAATRKRIREIADENKDELTDDEEELIDDTVAIILFERSDGIVEADWFDDKKDADKRWDEIEADTAESEEEDDEPNDDAFSDEEMQSGFVISDSRRGGYDVVHEHKHVGHYEDMDEALEAIEAEMKSSNFYPNIYYVNDHGNVELLDASGNVIDSRT